MGGNGTKMTVIFLPGNLVKVVDDGRGIPVEKHPQTKKSALETVMTTLHAGAKFGGKAYQVAGGLHGVGVSVVCALSKYLKAEVCRDGFRYCQEYSKGKPKAKIKKIGKCQERGTTIIFEPDPEIFKEIKFELKRILNHLRQQAYLTKGIRINIEDRRTPEAKSYSFYFEGGLKSYIKYLIHGSNSRQENTFYASGENNGILVEAAFQYTEDRECQEESFANNIYTTGGGTHLTGLRTVLTRTLNDYARKNNFLKDSDENLTGEDVREGFNGVVSVKIREPQFEGQTKAKLGNPEVKSAVETVISEHLIDFLERSPQDARAIIESCMLSQKARKAAKAARQTVLRKGVMEGLSLPGKLADCSSRKPEESELYIVEGESAGGSSRQARNRRYQAILPLRGKILNVERAMLDRILSSNEIKSLIIALGTSIADDFNLEKLRYHRIIIMTDADSVTGDTPIFLYNKEKQEFFSTKVGEFIENCDDTLKYQVLTYNSQNKKRELKEIYQTIKHPLRTPLYEIKTYCGYSIKVTSCHSVYVYENNQVITKKGSEIHSGDYLVFPKSFPRNNKKIYLDLVQTIFDSKKKNISIKLNKKDIESIPNMAWCELELESWRKFQREREVVGISRRIMGETIGTYDKVIQQWEQKIDNVMPRFHQFQNYLNQLKINPGTLRYDVYIPLNKWQEKKIPQNAKFYLENHAREIKTKFRLDKDISFLIGFFLGDGCASPEKGNPNRFSISLGKGEMNEYIKNLSRIIKEKFNAKPIIEVNKNNNISLHFHSFEFSLILRKLGLLGKKCNEKFIPDVFFNVKKEIQEALLEGLLQSDGFITVWPKQKTSKAIYGWRISSEKLALDILTIFRQFGIFPAYSINKTKDHLRSDGRMIRSNFDSYDISISTVDYLKSTHNIWRDHRDAQKIENYLKKVNYKKVIGKYIQPISPDFVGLKVKKIKQIKNPKDRFIYDFSVWKDQNFIAGPGGILLKNTDGAHIRTLLLTFFYRYFKPIIEHGYLYIAQPPLYRIQAGKRVEYAYSDADKNEIIDDIKKEKQKNKKSKKGESLPDTEEEEKTVSGINIQRYKGLGEMNPAQLWETTMNPENRILLKVVLEDAVQADRIFDTLMGGEVMPRKKFIQTYAKKVKNLDI